jgi:hypothetical protein
MSTEILPPTMQTSMELLSQLLLLHGRIGDPQSPILTRPGSLAKPGPEACIISRNSFDELVALAQLNHVVVRGVNALLDLVRETNDGLCTEWAETALAVENARIKKAIKFLRAICAAFEEEGFDVAVIKSLDHWPDLGSDLDLYTDAHHQEVSRMMTQRFDAQIAPRSWGDRLANKWNFAIPGLPELVEIHMGRMGQTGEQVTLASRLVRRARLMAISDYQFKVPSASDRIMISTLQRMYRHFYFRLCDIVDSAGLAEAGEIDYEDLRSSSSDAGIWEGVATYLVIVSDYVKRYRGSGIDLPGTVVKKAQFGGAEIYFNKDFLRVPIMPQSARLYGTQLAGFMRRRNVLGGARLSLLPWLASAALVGQKITGSDKGIW